jgi:hypothetical protein
LFLAGGEELRLEALINGMVTNDKFHIPADLVVAS